VLLPHDEKPSIAMIIGEESIFQIMN